MWFLCCCFLSLSLFYVSFFVSLIIYFFSCVFVCDFIVLFYCAIFLLFSLVFIYYFLFLYFFAFFLTFCLYVIDIVLIKTDLNRTFSFVSVMIICLISLSAYFHFLHSAFCYVFSSFKPTNLQFNFLLAFSSQFAAHAVSHSLDKSKFFFPLPFILFPPSSFLFPPGF